MIDDYSPPDHDSNDGDVFQSMAAQVLRIGGQLHVLLMNDSIRTYILGWKSSCTS